MELFVIDTLIIIRGINAVALLPQASEVPVPQFLVISSSDGVSYSVRVVKHTVTAARYEDFPASIRRFRGSFDHHISTLRIFKPFLVQVADQGLLLKAEELIKMIRVVMRLQVSREERSVRLVLFDLSCTTYAIYKGSFSLIRWNDG